MMSQLDTLQNSLNQSLNAFREELKAGGLSDLSLTSTTPHPLDDPAYLPSPKLYEARRTALASLGMLKALIQPPFDRLMENTFSPYETASLHCVVSQKVVDALAAAPDPVIGLHIDELQEKLDLDATKLVALLRLLATKSWFIETSENVFANGRTVLSLKGETPMWYWTCFQNRHQAKMAQGLTPMITHPEWKYSRSPLQCAHQIVHNTSEHAWTSLQKEPQDLQYFAQAMKAFGDSNGPGTARDYPWSEIDGKTIIDCGGGQGALTMLLMNTCPNSEFVVQDLPEVVDFGRSQFEGSNPLPAQQSRVKFEPHNFFDPQPSRGNVVFVLRWILHDWPDKEAVQILKNLAALGKGTKILVIESIVIPGVIENGEPELADPFSNINNAGQYERIPPPPGIPANFGEAAIILHQMGVNMIAGLNSNERTLTQFEDVFRQAGIRLKRVYHLRALVSIMELVVD